MLSMFVYFMFVLFLWLLKLTNYFYYDALGWSLGSGEPRSKVEKEIAMDNGLNDGN